MQQLIEMNERVQDVLQKTPVVNKIELLKNLKTGDIILGKRKLLAPYPRNAIIRTFSLFQGVPYSSCKLMVSPNLIGGYGIIPTEPVVKIKRISRWLDEEERVCVLRVNELSQEQIEKARKYIIKRLNLPYDVLRPMMSVWQRFSSRMLGTSFEIDEKQIMKFKEPLICSALVYLAIVSTGFRFDFNINFKNIWPKDFLLSEKTQAICRFESK